MSTNAKPYKETLNLPATRFDMKANLTVREPRFQDRWRARTSTARSARPAPAASARSCTTAPPTPTARSTWGTCSTRCSRTSSSARSRCAGFDSPYVPGWDCHGLPIEHKVVKDLGSKAAGMGVSEIRDLCHAEAMKWVDLQRDQFRRLGVMGDWDNPYLTLDPRYEAGILDVLADLLERGSIFRQLKPIHWCLNDRTALAEAELEYHDETSPSIYVNFPIVSGVPESWGSGPWHAMIWTTTPWTLPANVAIAVHPDLHYAGVRYVDPSSGQTVHTILAVDLVAKVMALRGITDFAEVGRVPGADLEGARVPPCLHRPRKPDRPGRLRQRRGRDGPGPHRPRPRDRGLRDRPDVRPADLEPGRRLGPVHRRGPRRPRGQERLRGQPASSSRPCASRASSITSSRSPTATRTAGGARSRSSSAPPSSGSWPSTTPTCAARTLQAIADDVRWFPSWGRSRIEAMVSLRPDWCISRQRSWGVPIPALGCTACGTQLLTAETVRHFRDLFRAEGADAWYETPVEELLPPGASCPKCGGTDFRKEGDILDVWFESGSSHRSVLSGDFDLGYPAYLYLEGSDQHRGWFQSSILTAVGTTGRAPFETVLTHGFVVDEQGKKMAKSGGNAVSAVDATEKYGADVLRLYVASMDYAEDVRMSERGIKEMSESYRKIRNTFRYLLGNLEDYARLDPSAVPAETLHEIDRWALGQLNRVIEDVRGAYERFEFYRVYQRIYQFCAVDLSSFYLDVLKDRLYAEAPDGPDRRAAQFVLARLHDALTRLLAPIIPHTAEELWDFLPDGPEKPSSVHLAEWPEPDPSWDDPARDARMDRLRQVREQVLRELEKLRAAKVIGSSQEAKVRLSVPESGPNALSESDLDLLTTLCIVSEIHAEGPAPTDSDPDAIGVVAERSGYAKCERCWNLRPSVGQDADHPTLCDRCVRVVSALPSRA